MSSQTMTEVLVDHQRQNAASCLCGWAKLGHSHPEHQEAMLAAAGYGETGPLRSALAGHLFDGESLSLREAIRSEMIAQVSKALDELDKVASIIRDLTVSDDCWFDHAGGCQAHGYISLQPGETCPQHEAKQWLKSHGVKVPE